MQKKILLLPLCLLLLGVTALCGFVIDLSYRYAMPGKAAVSLEDTGEDPYINRAEYVQPTEPPTESPTEPETEPEQPYYMQLDMSTVASYHQSNPDVVGWIKISGTVINYPVMQNGDNEFYVTHSWDKKSSHAGAILADFRCRPERSDNTLLYGHNMGNGSMFHAIKNYKVASWGNSHQYIEFATLEHRYLYKVLSCNVLYGEAGAKFEYWNYVEMNRPEHRTFLTNIRNTATAWYGDDKHLPRDNQQKMLTLQTCNSGANDGMRCIVFAYCIGER
ncbi:MAG: class B sortase [Oscillospiraceae bacterium]|nr:class B sortase [Oscillospiraceae bacterium]